MSPTVPARTVTPATRRVLLGFCVLTLLATSQLYVLTTHTDVAFAWHVEPPATAAFLGAGYASGFTLVVLSLTVPLWAHIRLAFLTIFVYTVFTLAATVLHLAEFHWVADTSGRFARLAALFWLIVYIAVPVAMLAALRTQAREAGPDPPRRRPLPHWIGLLLVTQGLALLVVGAVLFLRPAAASWLWPWELNPLGARAVAAWLLAIGIGTALGLREHDTERLRVPAIAYTVFAVFQLGVVARYPSNLHWGEPVAWLHLVALISMAIAGGAGWYSAAHARTVSVV